MAPKLSRDKLDLIDDLLYKSKRPKQALKELEKWLKKVPGSAQLQILKAQSLFECHRYNESRAVCEELTHQADALTDLQLINDLHILRFRHQNILSQKLLTSEADIVQLWQNAAKVQKSKAAVLLHWYGVAVSCDHWEDAQLAMAGLRKEDPHEPNYSFYYIALSHMLSDLQSSRDPVRSKLNGTLAYRHLETIFKNASASEENLVGRLTLTSQSLDLIIQIYIAQGRQKELLSLLENAKIHKSTGVGPSSWRILRIMFQILENERETERLRSLAIATISLPITQPDGDTPDQTNAEHANHDLLVFKALVKTSVEMDDTEKLQEAINILHNFQSEEVSFFSRRNSSIALMQLLISLHEKHGMVERFRDLSLGAESLFSACLRHFEVFGHHICCFNDIRKPLLELTLVERDAYLEQIKDMCNKVSNALSTENERKKWLSMETNHLKIVYLLRIARPISRDIDIDQVNTLLRDSFSALRIARSLHQYHGRDIYLIIVLASLRQSLKLNDTDEKNLLLMQIVCLLESSNMTKSEDRQILLLLSRLYSRLGFGAALICTYRKLRIKDILNEPLAHVLHTRISLNHPFPISQSELGLTDQHERDPVIGASRIIDKYASAVDTLNRLITDAHKTPVYSKLSEYALLKRDLNGSRTKQIVVLEKRRTKRLRGEQSDEDDLHEMDTWLQYSHDERELSILPEYAQGANKELEKLLQSGPPPNDYWIANMMLWDETNCCLSGIPTFRASDLKIAEGKVQKQEDEEDLTNAEQEMSRGWLLLRNYTKSHSPSNEHVQTKSTQELLSAIVEFARQRAKSICSKNRSTGQFPDSVALQETYLVLEYLKACLKIPNFHQKRHHQQNTQLSKSGGFNKYDIPDKDLLNDKMKVIESQVGDIRTYILVWRAAISKRTVSSLTEQLLCGPFGNRLKDIVGYDLLERIARTFIDNAVDALDGLLRAAETHSH